MAGELIAALAGLGCVAAFALLIYALLLMAERSRG